MTGRPGIGDQCSDMIDQRADQNIGRLMRVDRDLPFQVQRAVGAHHRQLDALTAEVHADG